jgi:hypothetical protein
MPSTINYATALSFCSGWSKASRKRKYRNKRNIIKRKSLRALTAVVIVMGDA